MTVRVCFVGLGNLPVLSSAHNHHGVGGEQVQHTLLAHALLKRGFEVSMIVGDYGQADGEVFDGISTFRAYAEGAGLPGFRLIYPKWTGLWSAAKRAAADIYYVSCADMHIGEMAMFAQRNNAKTVFRIASDADCRPNALLMRKDRFRVKYWAYKQLYFYGLRHASAILAQSEWQQGAMRDAFGLDSTVARMLVEGPYAGLKYGDRSMPVLWVANLRQVKRPDRVLGLAAVNPSITWHMVGGPQPDFEAMYTEIEAQSRSMSNLVFHGQIPYHDTPKYYRQARVFINTSDIEGFPNSFLQAWAAGTPVVTFFDPDGVVEKNGLGFVVNGAEQMAQKVRRLLDDEALWTECSQRCLAYMQRAYSEDGIMQPYLDAFTRVSNA